MEFKTYQQSAIKEVYFTLDTLIDELQANPSIENFNRLRSLTRVMYLCLGLGGEVGEYLEKFKKIIRDKNGDISTEDLQLLSKELGDVLWYTTALSKYLGLSLEEVAKQNIIKLDNRIKNNAIKGDGDLR